MAARVLVLGLVMAAVQYGLAVTGLAPLAALGAGLAGVLGACSTLPGDSAPHSRWGIRSTWNP
jgi:hypothetical protein